ncbi:MAG: GTPase, partial [Oscillospiraceae bacterium]
MNTTPNSNRLYISIFGRTNVGKSTLLNALTGQYSAIVSNTPGTTTDPVNKPIEINGLGACVITDTAGFDDITSLASERTNKTEIVLD